MNDTEQTDSPDPSFADLKLKPALLKAVSELGYETPSAIQAAAIPPLLEGRDLLGQAQTGTGKTAAFALPLLQRLDLTKRHVQAIVLAPTRELALQVAEAVRAYGKHLGERGVHVLPVYGGQPIYHQLKPLKRGGVHVVIGTPGRVKDHLERKTLSLKDVTFFGLDEADEMLKMGFIEDVEWILDHAPETRQVALFSATLPPPIRRVAEKYLTDPVDAKIARKTLTVPNIDQFALRTARHQKKEAVERILEAEEHEAILIFTRTQTSTAELAEHLQSRGYEADCLHGGMNQSQREAVLKRLRARRCQVVVGTDVAARGLDVEHIGLVINYDLPRDQEVYVHRIGRTGRAGRDGRAITFWQPRERHLLKSIERYSGAQLSRYRMPQAKDILDRRREKFAAQLKTFTDGDQEEFLGFIAEMVKESGLEPAQIAAAAARMAWGDGPLLEAPQERRPWNDGPNNRDNRGDRDSRGGHGQDRSQSRAREGQVEIVLPVGRTNNVRPGDIVGAITGEANVPGNVIGNIHITERVTFVSVPKEKAQVIIDGLQAAQICGRGMGNARLADASGGGGGGKRGPGGGGHHRKGKKRPYSGGHHGGSPPWKRRARS
jgi:ATP-dependent RNA helicase DeaD